MFKVLGMFFQKIIDLVGGALNLLFSFLPNSPFTIVKNSSFDNFVSQINFFIPVYEFIAIMQAWLVAIGIFYLYSIFARWVKAIN